MKCPRWFTHMVGSWCCVSAGSWTGATQLPFMWPLHLLGLLIVWQLDSKKEHSQHLKAEAAALLKLSLGCSKVKISITFYWSKLEPPQIRICTIFNPPHLSSWKKCCQQQNYFPVTYSKCLAYRCQNKVFWLFLCFVMKWVLVSLQG